MHNRTLLGLTLVAFLSLPLLAQADPSMIDSGTLTGASGSAGSAGSAGSDGADGTSGNPATPGAGGADGTPGTPGGAGGNAYELSSGGLIITGGSFTGGPGGNGGDGGNGGNGFPGGNGGDGGFGGDGGNGGNGGNGSAGGTGSFGSFYYGLDGNPGDPGNSQGTDRSGSEGWGIYDDGATIEFQGYSFVTGEDPLMRDNSYLVTIQFTEGVDTEFTLYTTNRDGVTFTDLASIPEPSTTAGLCGIAALAFVVIRRRAA